MAVNVMNLGGEYTYYAFAGASLPFSIGAMIFHCRNIIDRLPLFLGNQYLCFILSLLQIATWLLHKTIGKGHDYMTFMYISLAINSLTIVSLLRLKPSKIFSRELDSQLGKLSYPVYLTHVSVTLLASDLFFFGEYQSPLLLLFVTPPVLAVSWVLMWAVEEPIERLRLKVKANSSR
jgi:peptidoglycan/LPS O-acetylase OafA/YrhL